MVKIKIVHHTTGDCGNHNSGPLWIVTLVDCKGNEYEEIIQRKVAKRLITKKTQYTIDFKTKMYRLSGKKFYNIKWKGFKKPSIYPIK